MPAVTFPAKAHTLTDGAPDLTGRAHRYTPGPIYHLGDLALPTCTAHYSARDADAGTQQLPNRVNTAAAATTLGPTTGIEANDPTITPNTLLAFDGIDDYLQHPDTPAFTATTGAYTLVHHGLWSVESGAFLRLFSAESASNNGFYLNTDSIGTEIPRLAIGGSVGQVGVSPGGGTLTDGEAFVTAAVVDNGVGSIFLNGQTLVSVDISGVGTITFAPLRTGSRAYQVFSLSSSEWYDTLIFQDALTQEQLDAIAAILLAGTYT